MAIVCADSAKKFVENEVNFVIYSDLIKNSDIIVKKSKETPSKVGVSFKKDYHLSIVNDFYEDANTVTLMRNSMGYSLEKNQVDAIVIDLIKGISLNAYKENASSFKDYTTYVLLVNKDYMKTKDFKTFIKIYNKAVNDLQDRNLLKEHIESFMNYKFDREEEKLWKTLNLRIVPIELPNE